MTFIKKKELYMKQHKTKKDEKILKLCFMVLNMNILQLKCSVVLLSNVFHFQMENSKVLG